MMTEDLLAILVGSTARARVLRVFVFNQNNAYTLAHAAKRAGLSARVAHKQIRFFERAGIIKKGKFSIKLATGERQVIAGKQKEDTWAFDPRFKYAVALSKFVHEITPIKYNKILETLKHSGRFTAIILSGTFVGDPSRPADILVAADSPNEARLERAVRSLEPLYGREIRYAAFTTLEFRYRLTIQDRLIRETLDYPHLVLLDKTGLLREDEQGLQNT